MSNNVEPYFLTYITYYERRLVHVSSESKPYVQVVETESISLGSSRVGSTSMRRSAKGGEKKKAKNVGAAVTSVPIDDLCPLVLVAAQIVRPRILG